MARSPATTSGGHPARSDSHRIPLIILLVLLVCGTLVHPYMAQQASRYALTAAIVEQRSLRLDAYEGVLGVDRAVWAGHIYSDKAPGQPVLAVPFFAVGKAFGVEDATVLRVEKNLGLWWVTFWCSAVVGAVLAVLMFRRIAVVFPGYEARGSLGLFFGSLLFPFSALLFGHVMAAALLFASYLLLEHGNRHGAAMVAGLMAGMSVVVEYTAVFGVMILLVLVLWRHRTRWLAFCAGGMPAVVFLAVYNQVAFGAWHRLSYQVSAFSGVQSQPRDVLDPFSAPGVDKLIALLFHGRGLLIATPVVLVAVAGAVDRLRKESRTPDAVVAVAMFVVFALLPVFWGNPWGGDSPGPRYMVPMLPFLAVPLAWAWQRWRLLTIGAILLSGLTMAAAAFTDPLISRYETGGLGIWLTKLASGDVAPSLFTIWLGPPGWAIHLLIVAVTVLALARATPSTGASGTQALRVQGRQ